MGKIINFDLNEEQKKEVKKFIEGYKAYNFLTLDWRTFYGNLCWHKASYLDEKYFRKSTEEAQKDYELLKEKFIDYWNLQDEEKAELERIVNSDKTDYWDRYITHDFDGREEEALIQFLAFFIYEMNHFFKIK